MHLLTKLKIANHKQINLTLFMMIYFACRSGGNLYALLIPMLHISPHYQNTSVLSTSTSHVHIVNTVSWCSSEAFYPVHAVTLVKITFILACLSRQLTNLLSRHDILEVILT